MLKKRPLILMLLLGLLREVNAWPTFILKLKMDLPSLSK